MERKAIVRAGWKTENRFVAQLELHPAARLAVISLAADGVLSVRAETSRIGPGYHADVIARLTPILDELDYEWDAAPDRDPIDAMCAWLADELRGDGQRRVGVPVDRELSQRCAGADGARPARCGMARRRARRAAARCRCVRVVATRRRATARSRALLAMWLEVPWRAPLERDERELMEQVDTDLRAAHAAKLDVPWADWAELLDNLGADDDHATNVRARATGEAAIGYRRLDMDVELSGGWMVCLPARSSASGKRMASATGRRMARVRSSSRASPRPARPTPNACSRSRPSFIR